MALLWWQWVIVGFGLMGLELFVPGIYLLWLGMACLSTGFVTGFLDVTTLWVQLTLCALFTLLYSYVGYYFFYKPSPSHGLNRRGALYMGKTFLLQEPIVHGKGVLIIDDTRWIIEGPDIPRHTPVIVVGQEGSVLIVQEKANHL